jgi:hypothetical protein
VTAEKNFKRCRTALNILTPSPTALQHIFQNQTVLHSLANFFVLAVRALKSFKGLRRQRLTIFTAVGHGVKKN